MQVTKHMHISHHPKPFAVHVTHFQVLKVKGGEGMGLLAEDRSCFRQEDRLGRNEKMARAGNVCTTERTKNTLKSNQCET